MRGSHLYIITCRAAITARDAYTQVARRRADTLRKRPALPVVCRLAVIDVEDAAVWRFSVVVPDGVEIALLIGLNPRLDLIGHAHARGG